MPNLKNSTIKSKENRSGHTNRLLGCKGMKLKRILEPEVMDTAEEARDYNAMDHSAVNQQFVVELLSFACNSNGNVSDPGSVDLGDVLDLGTGTALIPIELCRQNENCRVMAIDMAVHMLELARYNIEANGLIERISLAQVDAKQMPYDDGMFNTAISNSIIHHIPEPLACIQEMVRVTDEGGIIFVRDLMRPENDQQVKHLVETYAGQENEHSKKMFDDSLRAALSLEEIQQMVEQLGFDPLTVSATSDRHWTWSAVKPSQDHS